MIKIKVLEDIKSITQQLFLDFGEVDGSYHRLVNNEINSFYSIDEYVYLVEYKNNAGCDFLPAYYVDLTYDQLKYKISELFFNLLEQTKEHR